MEKVDNIQEQMGNINREMNDWSWLGTQGGRDGG